MISYLQEQGFPAVEAWALNQDKRDCVLVLSLESCQIAEAGLGDYLGTMEDVEIFGKRCTAEIGIEFYAIPKAGEKKIQQMLDGIISTLTMEEGIGFALREFSASGTSLDSGTGRLKRKASMKSQMYLYYGEHAGEPVIDFNIKGVLGHGNDDN